MQTSIWFETLNEEQRRVLGLSDALPRTADVAIVGAGMIGLACAYYLSNAGASNICLVDRDTALAEASGANAGGLWFAQQSPKLGPLTPLAIASARLFDELPARLGSDFDLRHTGLLELVATEQEWRQSEARVAGVCGAGFRAERIGAEELRRLEPALGPSPAGAVFYPEEGQLHPGKLGAALVQRLRERNVRLCLHTEVVRVGPGRVETSRGPVDAGTILIAAGAWTPLVTRALGWAPPIKPVRGQLLTTPPQPPLLRHTVIGRHYYYWQLVSGHVAGGGTLEDVGFEQGTNPQDLADIRQEMDALFPRLSGLPTACAWSGFRPCCEDLRPVIGRVPGQERVYVAAGHFKKGVMLSPVTGKILADLITTGKTDLPIGPLDPARFGAAAPA